MKLTQDRFKLAESVRMTHVITPHHGTTVDQLLDPAYWTHVSAKMHAGDHIEAVAEDGSWFAELFVVRAERNWAKVALLRKVDLVATSVEVNPADFEEFYVKWSGPVSKFRVHRKKDKEVLRDGFESADTANAWLTEHRKALAR